MGEGTPTAGAVAGRPRPATGRLGLAISAAAHAAALAAFAGWAQPGQQAAGAAGVMSVTLVGPAPDVLSPAERALTAPQPAASPEATPESPSTPPPASALVAPPPAVAEPPQAPPPVVRAEPVAAAITGAQPPRARPRDLTRRTALAAREAPAAASPPNQEARGSGGAGAAGSGAVRLAAGVGAAGANARQIWGEQIRQRLQRRIARPTAGAAELELAISVAPDGTLRGASIAKSSGFPAVDAAALRALRRLGRLPAAPPGLTESAYAFGAPLILE